MKSFKKINVSNTISYISTKSAHCNLVIRANEEFISNKLHKLTEKS